MEPEIFKATCNYLRRERLLRDTRGVTIEEQLGMFLFMISHNASNEILKKTFQHSGETIHRHIKAVFNIIPTLTYKFVKLPSSNQTHPKIVSDPRFWPFFKNCIGAIDGTHVPITIAEEKASPYRNRKGTLSQNVMVACDFDLNFTFISCGGKGLLQMLEFSDQLLARVFMSQRSSRRSEYADYKEIFNHRHAILRNHIERAIGVLKKRFQILKVGAHYPIESQTKIPAAAAVFHNIIRGLNGDEEWLDHQPTYIQPSEHVDLPEGDGNYQNDVESLNLHGHAGNELRDQIAMQIVAMSGRALWNFNYEKGLVDILLEHNHQNFKSQNGWSPEGWRSIVKMFTEKFPGAGFSKAQIQDKEKELKGSYKAIRDGRKKSGAGCNDSLCMIIAEPAMWVKLIKDIPKLKKFQSKSFPLFYKLEQLHDGNIATGDLNFTSIEVEHPELQQQSNVPSNPFIDLDATNAPSNPVIGNVDEHRPSSEPINLEEREEPSSACSEHKGNGSGKKRKLSLAGVLQSYVDFRTKQTKTFMDELDETTKPAGDYSIKNCLDLLESIKELSDEEKAQATNILKSEVNREIFVNFKNPNVRLLWVKGEIAPKA
ncbi:hypothetical protein U9M48_040630 [Paspalum notatum var. saurae]|uniref:DDE Tnp4 domain-containing protein n=1 Tax=Paspalum notatum var. saurae TaxID=547442 RepID=A0AAQ3UMI3_PASNO